MEGTSAERRRQLVFFPSSCREGERRGEEGGKQDMYEKEGRKV